jgi:signal transduction histidine kinase
MTSPGGRQARLRWFGLPPRIAFGFGAALLSLAVAAGASYVALGAREAASRLVRHTAAAQLAVEELESALLVSHVALEAYVAGRDERHRAQLHRASAKIAPAVETLQRISEQQHVEERPRVARLAGQVARVRSEHLRTLALVEANAPPGRALDPAARESLAGAAEALAIARETLDELEEAETGAHLGREAAWSRSVLLSNAVFLTAATALLLLVLLAARLVRDEIRGREAEGAARERALLVQRRLMAVVSHDLRNPLTGILAAGGALTRGNVAPEAVPLARRIVSAGRRMERLIRDLLDWSRIHGGVPVPIQPREADLGEVARRIADELGERDATRVRVEHDGDTRAVLDPDRIEQVVANLLSNALQHAPAGTVVRVRTAGGPREVRVEVENGGPGIPPELQAEVFQPFRRGPGTDGPGVGLGLFIVRSLVEAHGGTVELDSAPGRTTFVVRLPRGDVREPERAQAPPASV